MHNKFDSSFHSPAIIIIFPGSSRIDGILHISLTQIIDFDFSFLVFEN